MRWSPIARVASLHQTRFMTISRHARQLCEGGDLLSLARVGTGCRDLCADSVRNGGAADFGAPNLTFEGDHSWKR